MNTLNIHSPDIGELDVARARALRLEGAHTIARIIECDVSEGRGGQGGCHNASALIDGAAGGCKINRRGADGADIQVARALGYCHRAGHCDGAAQLTETGRHINRTGPGERAAIQSQGTQGACTIERQCA